jgi:flagellar protein FlgJ
MLTEVFIMKIEKSFSLAPQKNDGTLSPEQDKKLREASKMYEQHFMNEMIKAMRSTVHHDDSFLKKNMAEKIFESQMDQKYAEAWAEKGGIGLQDMIYSQIKEKFFNRGNQMSVPQGPLPLPKQESLPVPKNAEPIRVKKVEPGANAQLQYWMEADPTQPSTMDVLSPWKGNVAEVANLENGWSKIKLDHGQGLSSDMTFQGEALALVQGDEVGAGQKLGKLNIERPVLAWKLDWS